MSKYLTEEESYIQWKQRLNKFLEQHTPSPKNCGLCNKQETNVCLSLLQED